MQYDEQLRRVLLSNGILLQDAEQDGLHFDSVQFISLIVDIEKEFCIEIPDEYLDGESLNNYNDFLDVITTIKREEIKKSNEANHQHAKIFKSL